MFQFLELSRLVNILSNPPVQYQHFNSPGNAGSRSKFTNAPTTTAIYCYAWTNATHLSYLAVCLTNGTLLFYRLGSQNEARPTLRQLPWYNHPSKHVSALCFDPSGKWLLVATKDATLYVLPALTFMDSAVEMDSLFSVEDATEIKLPGRRAAPTVSCWWTTSDGQPVAVIGNELGEISFINLNLRREVGGTYITVGITELQLIHDDANSCTYILITGTNEVQWQLILEQQSTSYFWPLEKPEITDIKPNRAKIFEPSSTMSVLSCLSITEDQKSSFAKEKDTRPKRLVQYAGHTRLKFQHFRGRSYVCGKYLPTAVLSVHHADLSITPAYIYKLPPNVSHVLLSDRLMFVVTSDTHSGTRLLAICTDLATSSIDGRQDFTWDCVLQSFALDSCEAVLGLVDFRSAVAAGVEGCVVITDRSVYVLRPRIPAEEVFLRIVLQEGDFSKADHFGKIMGLNIGSLYERAADRKLAESQVTAAVRLYQVAKCPHIRSVANFAVNGHLSELLSYVRVLFTTRSSDFSAGDLKHFSNIALYCFIQQSLEIRVGNAFLQQHFREFLRENHHYDELLAVHLLTNYGKYDLLAEMANWRGLWPHVMREILPSDKEVGMWSDAKPPLKPSWVDSEAADVFSRCGYDSLITLEKNESFLNALLPRDFALHVGLHTNLVRRHLKLTQLLISSWNGHPDRIVQLLNLYNPTQPPFFPVVNVLRCKCDPQDSNEEFNFTKGEMEISASDLDQPEPAYQLVERFLSLLLMLCKFCDPDTKYNSCLVPKLHLEGDVSSLSDLKEEQSCHGLRLPRRSVVIGCGYAHAAAVINGHLYTWGRSLHDCLGRGPVRSEWLSAMVVSPLKHAAIRVFSVACGASHTLTITDAGLYAWGLDRYGQLGIGGGEDGTSTGRMVLKMCHPTCVSALFEVNIVSVTCGQYHSLALASDGSVFSWGWGVHGQLGHGTSKNLNVPQKVDFFNGRPISRISAGYGHSLFLAASGEVYVCGCGTFGQLGNSSLSKTNLPIQVDLGERVALAAAGYFHNVVISTSSKIYTWGWNPQTLRLRAQASRRARTLQQSSSGGEMGGSGSSRKQSSEGEVSDSSFCDSSTTPPGLFVPSSMEVEGLSSAIVHVACGANHSLLLTDDGDVYTWGRNLDGQLGHSGRKEKQAPTPVIVINDRKIVQAACGADFTLLLDSSGKFWGFGIDNHGQICGATEKGSGADSAVPASPGKILTVRTNKRILQIKSPTRSSIYKPIILNALPSVQFPVTTKVTVEEPAYYLKSHRSVPRMGPLEDCNNITSAYVHLVIEKLHGLYDSLRMEIFCESLGNLQAAAKIALLSGRCGQSFTLHMQCLASDDSLTTIEKRTELALQLLETYTKPAANDSSTLRTILEVAMAFWTTHSLPLEQLERFLTTHLPNFLLPLSALILRNYELGLLDEGMLPVNYFTSRLSSRFCLVLMTEILQKIQAGVPHPKLLDTLADMVNLDAIKDGLLHKSWNCGSANIQACKNTEPATSGSFIEELQQKSQKKVGSSSFVDLSTTELQNLLHADATKSTSEIPRAVVFTCGHHYRLDTLNTTVLPRFKELLSEMAPISTRSLTDAYGKSSFRPMACPKCLIEGVREETTQVLQ